MSHSLAPMDALEEAASARSSSSAGATAPGKAAATSRLAARAPLILRVESAEAAAALAERFGPRDENGVAAGAEAAVQRAAQSSGAGLPAAARARFERSLGADLSAVRVHTGAESAAAASALGARAFTRGQDIHFGSGQYAPEDPFGLHLLAHEVAHTQQQGGAPAVQCKLEVSSPGDSLEHEADRAADAMIHGAPARVSGGAASTSLARALASATDKEVGEDRKKAAANVDDDPDTYAAQWKQLGGPALLAAIKTDLTAWRTYRKSPATAEAMPRQTIFAALIHFADAEMTPELREYASRKLGPERLSLLEELVAVNNLGNTLASIFHIKARKVKHHYQATFSSVLGVTHAKIHYSNDLPFPWKWTSPPILMSGATFGVNLAKPKGAIPMTPGLEVNGEMTTDKPPVAYWGWRDFAGGVQVVNFPSAGVTTQLGGPKVTTGTTVTFSGGPGKGLSFANFAVGVGASGPSGKGKAGGKGVNADVTIGYGGAMGSAVVGGDDLGAVTSQEVSTKARLVDAQKSWKARITHFANGSAELPADAGSNVHELVELVREFVAAELADPRRAEALQQNGVDPARAFAPEIEVQGWATVRWADAPTDAERQRRNQELSQQRAAAVASVLTSMWGPWPYQALAVSGMGEGLYAPVNQVEPAADGKKHLAELTAKLADKRAALTKAKTAKDAKSIEALQFEIDGLEFDVARYQASLAPPPSAKDGPYESWLRQAAIFVRWKGKVVDLGATSAEPEVASPSPSVGLAPKLGGPAATMGR
jgi:Domain of unknown function (DUF4157)